MGVNSDSKSNELLQRDNPLLIPLGSIPSNEVLLEELTNVPHFTGGDVEMHERSYRINAVRKMAVPDGFSLGFARSLDIVLRSSYECRDPRDSRTIRALYSNYSHGSPDIMQPQAVFLQGLSGVGKSVLIQRLLNRYPQVHLHDYFPSYAGALPQLLWLHIDMPASGSLRDLASHLIDATVSALDCGQLADSLYKGRPSGSELFRRWVQIAKSRFLGVLVLDEVQNIFGLRSMAQRSTATKNILRVADDALLKEFLLFANNSQVAVVMSGTPDAAELLSKRMSIAQRLITGGSHVMRPFSGIDDPSLGHYLPQLLKYQFHDSNIEDTVELREIIFFRTAGIRRLIRTLWEFAHRVAADKQEPLNLGHLEIAANTYLAPVQPAVKALINGDPGALGLFEDLVEPRNNPA